MSTLEYLREHLRGESAAIVARKEEEVTATKKEEAATAIKVVKPKPPCHRGNVLTIETAKLRIYGGGITRGAYVEPGWLVVNLTEHDRFGLESPLEMVGVDIKSLDAWMHPRFVRIPVRDFDAPIYPESFWTALIEGLHQLADEQAEPLNVLVCCQGGHGRTGTALAVLAHRLLAVPNPIEYVRMVYCEKAVESLAQVEYVEDITGCFEGAVPAKIPVAWKQGTPLSAAQPYQPLNSGYLTEG